MDYGAIGVGTSTTLGDGAGVGGVSFVSLVLGVSYPTDLIQATASAPVEPTPSVQYPLAGVVRSYP